MTFRQAQGLPSRAVLDLDLGAVHQSGFRPFMIRGEVSAYWTVYDGAYEPVALADCYLRRVRFGSGKALGTTRMYAGNLALFFEFCLATGRSLRQAALEFDRFVHYLAVTPIERRGRGHRQLRSPERINHILCSVRELYRERSRVACWMARCSLRCFGSSGATGFRWGWSRTSR
jgi:hypothetical protein